MSNSIAYGASSGKITLNWPHLKEMNSKLLAGYQVISPSLDWLTKQIMPNLRLSYYSRITEFIIN